MTRLGITTIAYFLSSTSTNSASTTLSFVFSGPAAGRRHRRGARAVRPGLRPSALVHRLGQFVAGRGQPIDRRVDLVRIVLGCISLLGLFESLLDLLRLRLADLAAMLLQRLLDVVDHRRRARLRASIVSSACGRPPRATSASLRHLLHFVLGQAGRGGDSDLLLVVGGRDPSPSRSGCRWHRYRTSLRSAARRAEPAECCPAGTRPAAGCRAPWRARPGRP